MPAAEVIVRRRRGYGPFERGALPRILRGRLSPKPAVNEVVNENQLHCAGKERGDRDELVHPNQWLHVIRCKRRVAAHIASQSQVMHRHENAINADKCEVEVKFPKGLVHHPPPHLREPEVSSGEDAKQRRDGHRTVEMSHYEVGWVEQDLARGLRPDKPAAASDDYSG